MGKQPWYAELFGKESLRISESALTSDRTQHEVAQLIELLGLALGSVVLDLCCGHGRHAIALAERGYRITGLDLGAFFLKKAADDAAGAGAELELVHSDVRSIPFQEESDAIVNGFSSCGYLENAEEDQRVLDQVRKVLKPGAGSSSKRSIRRGYRHFQPPRMAFHRGQRDCPRRAEHGYAHWGERGQANSSAARRYPAGERACCAHLHGG